MVRAMAYGKVIEMFLVNGSADSFITAELSNWNGKALKIPRIEVRDCKGEDIKGAGVYFLFCKDEVGDTDSVYIGEAENVKERLIQHMRDYPDKEKYYWNTAVVFLGRDLNKTLIRYLENRFVEIARECNRYEVLTKNTYRNTVMKESQIVVMNEFIDNAKILINALGYKVLEPIVQSNNNNDNREKILYIKTGSVDAKGIVTAEGFVLLKDSIISEKNSKNDKVSGLRTIEDILFSSSSSAARFVTGYSSISGPQAWKDKRGRTLKELEQEENNNE